MADNGKTLTPMAAPKPRLLLFITEFQMGGAARVVRDHARIFASKFEVSEAAFNAADGLDLAGKVVPHSLDVGGGGGPLRKILNFLRRVRRLKSLKGTLGTDVTVSHLEGAHYVDVLSNAGEKNILCVHGSIAHNRDIAGFSGAFRKRVMIPWLYNRASRIVAVSRDIAAELRTLGVQERKLRVINNFFDLDEIRRKAQEPIDPDDEALFAGGPVILTSGRLHPQKNQAPLFDAIAGTGAKLVVLGDGPLRGELISLAEATGLSVRDVWSDGPAVTDADVHFIGVKSNPFAYLRRADLFVFPSAWEGFPLALCEAMACGVAVVASDCPTGPREILAPATATPAMPIQNAEQAPYGMLMPIPNTGDRRAIAIWAETISSLLANEERRARLAAAGLERIGDFGCDRIAGQWFSLIDEVLAEPR